MTVALSPRHNIMLAMVAKVVSMGVAVVSVPLLLSLLGTENYGTWVTLTSLLAFLSVLDLGFGNSVRNSAAGLDAGMRDALRHEFVAFFQLLGLVGLGCTLVFAIASNYWPLLATNHLAASLLYVPLLLFLPLLLGSSVLQGVRATGLQSLLQSAGSWLFFALVVLMSQLHFKPTLSQLALGWTAFYASALVVTFALALRIADIPVRGLFCWSLSSLPRSRITVGIEFLALQLASLVLYSLGNALIYHELGAGEVARYDVLNKLFQVALSFYTIVIGVMWAEISRDKARGDSAALTRTLRRLRMTALAFSFACVIGACLVPTLIEHWTRHRLEVSLSESFAVAALVSMQAAAYIGAVFMNAFEQIRLQVLLACVSIGAMVPLSLLLMHHGFGIAAVPLAATSLTLLPAIVCNRAALRLIASLAPRPLPRANG